MMVKRGQNLTKIKTISSPIRILLFLLIVFNLADIATTVYGFSLGAGELNPLFQRKSFITTESLMIKIVLSIVFTSVFTVSYRLCAREGFDKGKWMLNIILVILAGIYSVVLVNNLAAITMALR